MSRILIAALGLFFTVGAGHAADVISTPAHGGHGGGYAVGGHHDLLPACGESRVVARISERFAFADQSILRTGLLIASIDGVHEHALRAGGTSLIDRRYCGATARLTDGGTSEVVYLIEAGQGFASHGWNVESCLPAFDPYHVYGARCRSVRP